MKSIEERDQACIPGRRLGPDDTFNFECHASLECFNQCCRNLNLFLYPYDVLRLSRHLKITTDAFIQEHVDVVLREDHHFPEVLLRMAANQEHTCPFLTAQGCRVYADRPDTCRTFPVEQGARFDTVGGRTTAVNFFRPPDFCLGRHADKQWNVRSWARDQEAERHHEMTMRWAKMRSLFQNDPWGAEGPQGAKAKMAFMATYNLDRFREFIFDSSFLKRFGIKPAMQSKLRANDRALLLFGFEWVQLCVWGIASQKIRPRPRNRER